MTQNTDVREAECGCVLRQHRQLWYVEEPCEHYRRLRTLALSPEMTEQERAKYQPRWEQHYEAALASVGVSNGE